MNGIYLAFLVFGGCNIETIELMQLNYETKNPMETLLLAMNVQPMEWKISPHVEVKWEPCPAAIGTDFRCSTTKPAIRLTEKREVEFESPGMKWKMSLSHPLDLPEGSSFYEKYTAAFFPHGPLIPGWDHIIQSMIVREESSDKIGGGCLIFNSMIRNLKSRRAVCSQESKTSPILKTYFDKYRPTRKVARDGEAFFAIHAVRKAREDAKLGLEGINQIDDAEILKKQQVRKIVFVFHRLPGNCFF